MKKTYSKKGDTCRVTFEIPAEVNAEKVNVVGDFNDWNQTSHELKKRKAGNFSTTISLQTGKEYRYRYLLDDERWENDWNADKYLPNEFGEEDSIVSV